MMKKSAGKRAATPRKAAAKSSVKKPNPIDTHVGSRVRLRRMVLGMSQEKLGNLLGLTFQQVQKYEKGTNRIGASRLFKLSEVLDVPVGFFYDELPGGAADSTTGFAESKTETSIVEFMNSREGVELNRAFVKVTDPKVRRNIIDLVRSLSQKD